MTDDQFDGKKVLLRWKPTEADRVTQYDDIAEEYVVVENLEAASGIVKYAKYGGEWKANPWSTRALVRYLIDEKTRIEKNYAFMKQACDLFEQNSADVTEVWEENRELKRWIEIGFQGSPPPIPIETFLEGYDACREENKKLKDELESFQKADELYMSTVDASRRRALEILQAGNYDNIDHAAQKAVGEIERLTTALHAVKAHPDFSYVVTLAGGMALFGKSPLESDSWERCHEAEIVGLGDECWRRRKKP